MTDICSIKSAFQRLRSFCMDGVHMQHNDCLRFVDNK